MKVLLIIPYVPLEVIYGKLNKEIGSVMPSLGIFYLASYLKSVQKHDVEILDANVLQMDTQALEKHIAGKSFDCIGFTATTLGYSYAVENAKAIRELFPGVKIVLGGPHAQAEPGGILKENPGLFDFVCYGEGEFAFELLLDFLEAKIAEKELRGWMYLQAGQIIETPPAPIPENLDVFGHPARLLPREWIPLYHEKIFSYKKLPMFSLMSSRGCPFQCTFCSTPRKFKKLYQGRVRFHSIEWIIEEMKILEDELGINEVNFWDDTFNVKRQRVLDFCKAKLDNKLRMTWSCNFEANIADVELMKAMKAAGCWSIMVGGESGSDRMLEFIKKGVTSRQLRLVGKWANEVGLVSRVSFILGLPTDTRETIAETLEFIKQSDFHLPYFQLYVPLPGTEMFEQLATFGEVVIGDPKKRSASKVNYLPRGLTEEFLLEKYSEAYKVAYLRWKMVWNHLQFIRSWKDVKRYWLGLKALRNM